MELACTLACTVYPIVDVVILTPVLVCLLSACSVAISGLNGDEAMAMGAVFRAANLSATHHVRPFGFTDVTLYPVGVRIANLPTEAADSTAAASEEGADFSKRASLFRKYNRLGKRKTVQFSHTRDFTASLFHDSTKQLPRDIPVSDLFIASTAHCSAVTVRISSEVRAEYLLTNHLMLCVLSLLVVHVDCFRLPC